MTTFPDDFDPTSVPPFPVVVIEVNHATLPDGTRAGFTAAVDAISVPLAGDASLADATEAAIAAAAAKIDARGWDAARVNAIDPDGHQWRMVVGAQGQRATLGDPTQGKKSATKRLPAGASGARPRARTPRWVWPLLLVCATVVIAVAVLATTLLLRPRHAVPTVTPTPTPAELPTFAPQGWSTHATWAYPGLATERAIALPDGSIAVLTKTGLDVVDTGHGHGTAHHPGADNAGPFASLVDNTPVIVTHSNSTITWRQADNLANAHTAQLPSGATVTATPAGTWILTGQTAYILHVDGSVEARTIPAGATIIGISDATLTACDKLGNLWQLSTDNPHTPAPARLAPPVTGATFVRALGSGNGVTAAVWKLAEPMPGPDTKATTAAIAFHRPDGGVTKSTTWFGDPGQPQPALSETYISAGKTLLDTATQTVTGLQYQPKTISGDAAWGADVATAWRTALPAGTTTSSARAGQALTPAATTPRGVVVIHKGIAYLLTPTS